MGSANFQVPLMGAGNNRKVTPGITELSRRRVHIDGAVATSMSALPILDVQKHPRVRVFTD